MQDGCRRRGDKGGLQQLQPVPGHRDALTDVAGEPAQGADGIPVLLTSGLSGHPQSVCSSGPRIRRPARQPRLGACRTAAPQNPPRWPAGPLSRRTPPVAARTRPRSGGCCASRSTPRPPTTAMSPVRSSSARQVNIIASKCRRTAMPGWRRSVTACRQSPEANAMPGSGSPGSAAGGSGMKSRRLAQCARAGTSSISASWTANPPASSTAATARAAPAPGAPPAVSPSGSRCSSTVR